jgi:hypothetical protein
MHKGNLASLDNNNPQQQLKEGTVQYPSIIDDNTKKTQTWDGKDGREYGEDMDLGDLDI